jgi:signal transduction histidine kinase
LARLSLSDVDPDFDRARLAELLEEAERRISGLTFEGRLRRQDGTYLLCEIRMGAVHLENGVRRILFAARNITERHELEQRLREALMKGEESDRMKSAFLSTINHEIRTPLNIIVGYGSLVADLVIGKSDRDRLEVLSAIERATARLLGSIHSILDLSRIQSEGFATHPEPVDVSAVLLTRLRQLLPDAERKGIALRWEVEEEERLVRFDRYCLSEAIAKLLDNAIKFTERGEITVKLHRDEAGGLRLDVRDTGVGIAKEYQPRLFQAFSQEDSGMNRRFEGSGTGLMLTKTFLELNGAAISAESEKGSGSLFSVHFPAEIEIDRAESERAGTRRSRPRRRARA